MEELSDIYDPPSGSDNAIAIGQPGTDGQPGENGRPGVNGRPGADGQDGIDAVAFNAEDDILADPDISFPDMDTFPLDGNIEWEEEQDSNAFFDTSASLTTYTEMIDASADPQPQPLHQDLNGGGFSSFGDGIVM